MMAQSKKAAKSKKAVVKEIPVTFRLDRFEIVSFNLNPVDLKDDIDLKTINYNIGYDVITVLEKNEFIILIKVVIHYKDKMLGNIATRTIFDIPNLSQIVKNITQESNFDEAILAAWLTIAYSTTRGILLEKTAISTPGPLLLPLIEPLSLIKLKREAEEKLKQQQKV